MLSQYVGTIARMWNSNPPDYFVDSLAKLIALSPGWNYEKASMSWHEGARNELAGDKFLGEWLFMLDTDHCFAPDVLRRLRFLADKYEAKVISGIYQYKSPPHLPVCGYFTENNQAYSMPLDKFRELKSSGAEVEKVDLVGAGCLLIHRSVINSVKKKFGEPFSIISGLSEDYSFCFRCKELGIPIYLALNVEAHHSIPTMLSVDDLLVKVDLSH